MKFTIIGAGAIGGLAGAYMTRAGHDVLLVDRWQEHVDALNANGMTIHGVRGDLNVKVKATTTDQLSGDLGVVLIATKSQHTLEALKQIMPLLTAESAVVSYQNGFNEPDMVALLDEAGLPGKNIVIGSIPNYGGALVDPGYIEFVHEGPIQLGELSGEMTQRLKDIGDALSALTEVQYSDCIWGQIWAKEVYSAQVVCSAIADANKIDIQAFDFFDPANYRVKTAEDTKKLLANIDHAIWLLKKDQDNKPTHNFKKKGSGIWWDIVYRKRPSETRAFAGKLIEFGKKAGADTRLNEKMVGMIYEIEDGKRELGFHNFDELEAYAAEIGKTLP